MAAKGARKGKAKSPHSRPAVAARNPDGTVKAGTGSLNPGGLPKWRRELAEAMKESAQAGANLLDAVIRNEDADMGHRIQAASVALKLTVPAPKQQVELSGSVGALAQLDAATLLKLAQGE